MSNANARNQNGNGTGRVIQLDIFSAAIEQGPATAVEETSPVHVAAAGSTNARARAVGALPPGQLRAAAREIRAKFHLHDQDEAVNSMSVLAALHVAGGLRRGGRPLIIGPSGCGKTTLLRGLADAMFEWGLPVAMVDAIELTGPGWSGAPSIDDVIEAAWVGRLTQEQKRKTIVVIDEIHHARLDHAAHGNMASKQREVLASLLSIVGGGSLQLGEFGTRIETSEMLVVCCGAFTGMGLDRDVTAGALVRYGIPIELATRFDQIVRIRTLDERAIVAVLKQHEAIAEAVQLYARLGLHVRIHEQTFSRAARAVAHDPNSTPRTAVGWIVSALRAQLESVLFGQARTSLELSPDSLDIPRSNCEKQRTDYGSGEAGVL